VHEQHIVAALIERLPDLAELDEVTEIRVGASPAYSPEALEQAWAMLTLDSPLEGSRLVVEERLDERVCGGCGTTWAVALGDVAGHVVLCPSCGTPAPVDLGSGIVVLGVSRGDV
jgi:Zn finger protein HypA/HybF involved in hydrogenase expression